MMLTLVGSDAMPLMRPVTTMRAPPSDCPPESPWDPTAPNYFRPGSPASKASLAPATCLRYRQGRSLEVWKGSPWVGSPHNDQPSAVDSAHADCLRERPCEGWPCVLASCLEEFFLCDALFARPLSFSPSRSRKLGEHDAENRMQLNSGRRHASLPVTAIEKSDTD